jgi:hypothetical protein
MDSMTFILPQLFKTNKVNFYKSIVSDPTDRDYYIAKFSTQYNYTEWYRNSDKLGINETVKGLYYDKLNQIVFMIVEVWSNSYFEGSTFETFANP